MNYNTELYMEILGWFTNQYAHIDKQWPSELVLEIWHDYYVNIHYTSEGEIDVSHYNDIYCEDNIDWGWVVMMEEFHDTIELNEFITDPVDLESLNKEITDKCEFIYQLCFTW